MNSHRYAVHSEDEMLALGERLAGRLPAHAVVLLTGNLGAGKTTLTKGIVKGLGAAPAEEVSSPTFTLIHEYGDPVRVYHVDLYRLEDARQLLTLGLEEIFDRNAVAVVEWADKFPGWMPPEAIQVRIEGEGADRTVTVIGLPSSPADPQSSAPPPDKTPS